jgi:Fe-S-cluster containining protein
MQQRKRHTVLRTAPLRQVTRLPSHAALRHAVRMEASLTDTLCTRCGLCCDGTLFADVELASRAEATRLEALGLEIESDDDAPLLVQPCAALRGRRCSIYAHRPGCCRTFECKLLRDVRGGVVSVEEAGEHISHALESIHEVQELLVQVGPGEPRLPLMERCAEVLMHDGPAEPAIQRARTRLTGAMAGLERQVRDVFLGGRGPAR